MFILLVAVFAAVLAAALAASRMLTPQPDPARARLRALAGRLAPGEETKLSTPDHLITASSSRSAGTGHLISRKEPARGLQLELLRAGLKLRPAEYRTAAATAVIAWGAVGLLAPYPLVSAAVLALVGLCVPPVILKLLQAARVRKFEAQLSDALTLIASSLRSGYSFLRAVQVVGEQMPDPIAEEFRRAVAESHLGMPIEQALGQMVERVASYDLELIVTAVNIQLQVGGNLAQILDTIAATIRERVRNRREIVALTAEAMLSGFVCIAMPPAMFVFLWFANPGYLLPLFRNPLGEWAFGIAAALQAMGVLWTRALVRIDV